MLIVLGIYLAIVLGVAWLSLHPLRTPLFVSPGLMGAPQEETVLDVGKHLLRAWWVPAEEPRGVVVMVHGYLMNRAELAPVAAKIQPHGFSTLLIDLRAHGKSGGRKCTLGYREREDVRTALLWARARSAGKPVIVLGSSMGSAASALALAEDPRLADALIMDSGYSRLSSAILGWWRFLGGTPLMVLMAPSVFLATPMAGFWPFSIDVAKALAQVGPKPVLHFHGTKDNLALPSEAERNLSHCAGPSRIVWFEGLGHSEYRWERPDRYMAELLAFLDEAAILAENAAATR